MGCGPISYAVRRVDGGGTCPIFDEDLPEGNDNEQLNDYVFFCCDDVGQDSIMVQFEVCDDANQDGILGGVDDLCNSVMVFVEVQDKLPPSIECPADMTISCIDYYAIDLEDLTKLDQMFGEASSSATCQLNVSQTILSSEFCGAGEIVRRLAATNDAGSDYCDQRITVEAEVVNQLTCDRISFIGLDNSIYNWCDVNNDEVDTDDLPSLKIDCSESYTVPELDIDLDALCTEAGVSVTIDTFAFAGDACRKYLVHYEVIDQCIYQENYFDASTGEINPFVSENGYFEFYIEIDAFDNEGPTLSCEERNLVAENCIGYEGAIGITGSDNCTDPNFFGVVWKLDLNSDGIIDYPETGYAESNEVTPTEVGLAYFPLGKHEITWVVSDGCGNTSSCTQVINIGENDKAPTPYCYDGISSVVLADDGTFEIWASDFDAGSLNTCQDNVTLTLLPDAYATDLSDEEAFALSLNHPDVVLIPGGTYGFRLSCENIPNGVAATIPIRMYVSNPSGKFDYCIANLRLEDHANVCEDNIGGALAITGMITTEEGKALEKVVVELGADFAEFPIYGNTDENGVYLFETLYDQVDYQITPKRDFDYRNGVSTLDLVLIQRHILGIQDITSPYDLIAADVNGDCGVKASDILQLRKMILGYYVDDNLPNNESWRFVAHANTFNDNLIPCDYMEQDEILKMDATSQSNFTAVKIGDINHSAKLNANDNAVVREYKTLDFVIPNQQFTKGQFVEIDFLASDYRDVEGFQFDLALSKLKYSAIESGGIEISGENIGTSFVDENHLLISYANAGGSSVENDSILFTLRLLATEDGSLDESISMSDFKLDPEVYVGENLTVFEPKLNFRDDDQMSLVFRVEQNAPNPFVDKTTIAFTIPKDGNVRFVVFDISGKEVITREQYFDKGSHTFEVTTAELNRSGAYYYQIEAGEFKGGKTMIAIDNN